MHLQKQFNFGNSNFTKDLTNSVLQQVVQNDKGLAALELIREFFNFYKMEHSMGVFLEESSLSKKMPKARWELERDLKIRDSGDTTKPLLIKLMEQSGFEGEDPVSQPIQ